jgi:hypothetical protein
MIQMLTLPGRYRKFFFKSDSDIENGHPARIHPRFPTQVCQIPRHGFGGNVLPESDRWRRAAVTVVCSRMKSPALLTALIAIALGGWAGTVCPRAAAEPYNAPPCPNTAAVINPPTQQPHPNCKLYGNGLTFDVFYFKVPEIPGPQAVRVTVTDGSGAPVQTIDELLEPSSPSGVGLQDLDGDGRDEVIIPMSQSLSNGSPNTLFSVWRAAGDGSHFVRIQMVGQAVYPGGDGYVVVNGGSPSSRDLTFYLPTGAGFTLVAVLTIEAQDLDPDTHRVLTVTCRARQQNGLQAVDMDMAAAQDTFCGSAAARAIFPDAQRI